MKKLILFCLLILIYGSLKAQNTISVVHYPTDMGIGLRYDRQIQNSGIYIAMSKGNYRISESERINNHIKTVIGALRYFETQYDDITYISAGMSYHYYNNRLINQPQKVYHPLSLDLGCGVKFEHTMIGFCFDFLKWEGGVNAGINF